MMVWSNRYLSAVLNNNSCCLPPSLHIHVISPSLLPDYHPHTRNSVAPTVIALDVILFRRVPHYKIVASVLVVCMGIAVATVTDTQV